MWMQLSLGLFENQPLAEAQARLLPRFGPQRGEGRRDPISQLVKAIVSSRTYDVVSQAAFQRLERRFPDWEALMRAESSEVEALIEKVTFAKEKAACMIAALNIVHAHAGRLTLDFLADLPVESALAWLERIHGVGRKIAAAILNFSTLRRLAFVADTHVLRVAQRMGWIPPKVTTTKAYDALMALVPQAWEADDLYEMHWLLKRLGQGICTFERPDCSRCPLATLCPRGKGEGVAADRDLSVREEEGGDDGASVSNDNALSLKAKIARLERSDAQSAWGVAPFGDSRVDACFPMGGLPLGRWHEIVGDGLDREIPGASTGFAACLAQQAAPQGAIIWALQRDDLHVPGLSAFGFDPDRLILVRGDNDADILSILESSLRARGVVAAIGEVSALGLIAGRRLQLACESGGATGFVLNRKLYGVPRSRDNRVEASAAATRWRIAPASSQTHEPGLGLPRWQARLERCRGGRTGAWIMESQYATGHVRVVAELADHAVETIWNDADRWEHRLRDGGAARSHASVGGC